MSGLGIYSWYGYQKPIERRFAEIAQAGFSVTTLWMWESPQYFYQGSLSHEVRLARECGLTVENVHLPYEQANDWWQDPVSRARLADITREQITQIGQAGIPMAVLHVENGSQPPHMTAQGMEAIYELCQFAAQQGVILAAENLRHPVVIEHVLSQLPQLRFCFDTSHAQFYTDSGRALLKRHGARICCLHLSDSFGVTDDHMLPGLGGTDWPALMKMLADAGYTGNLTLEVYPNPNHPMDSKMFITEAFRCAQWLNQDLQAARQGK